MNEQDHRERLTAFVIRLRRVLASPLAQDDEQLSRSDKWSMIALETGDVVEVKRWLPDEQQLESLAARIRPLFLNKDPVYCQSALSSMGFLLANRSLPHLYLPERKVLKRDWTALDKAKGSRYFVQAVESEAVVGSWQDSELVKSWLYGDLIHASNHADGPEPPDIEERFMAAFAFIGDVVRLCWRTFGVIFLVRRALALPDKAWTTEVAVEGNRWFTYESPEVWTADPGTKLPPEDGWKDDPSWKSFYIPPEELERLAKPSNPTERLG